MQIMRKKAIYLITFHSNMKSLKDDIMSRQNSMHVFFLKFKRPRDNYGIKRRILTCSNETRLTLEGSWGLNLEVKKPQNGAKFFGIRWARIFPTLLFLLFSPWNSLSLSLFAHPLHSPSTGTHDIETVRKINWLKS